MYLYIKNQINVIFTYTSSRVKFKSNKNNFYLFIFKLRKYSNVEQKIEEQCY
jgi:hypothetical protein